jgi:uncharacterized membrane protein YeaQ/YmgE (transglycosylase-associated protein family)
MGWIWTIIAGAVVGLLGKLFAPGDKDNVPILLVIVLGVVGVLVGRVLAEQLGVRDTAGGDWIKWTIQIGLAVVLVMITSVILARRGTRAAPRGPRA